MKDLKTKEHFVELRAMGKSYSEIAIELKTSKQTLITWSKELQNEIINLRAIEWESIQKKCLASKEHRLEIFGKMLEKVVAEIEKRELADIESSKLFEIVIKYASALKSEDSGMNFKGTEAAMQFQMEKEVFWPA